MFGYFAGMLDKIDRLLCTITEMWTEVAENGNKLRTWAFACRYHLSRLVAKVEQGITPRELDVAFTKGSNIVDKLPSDSLAVAAASMANMLRRINERLLEVEELDTELGF